MTSLPEGETTRPIPGHPRLTNAQKKALQHVLLHGQIPDKSREELARALEKMGYETALQLTSSFHQHALGRIMNDVVQVEAPLAPPRTLRGNIKGLLQQMLAEDEAPIAAVFSQATARETPSQARSSAPKSTNRGAGPKLSDAQQRALQHALAAPIEEDERVQKAGRRSEATLARLEGLGLLKFIKGKKHHKTDRPGRRSRHGITAQGKKLLEQLGLEAIESKTSTPSKRPPLAGAKKSPRKTTKKQSPTKATKKTKAQKTAKKASLGPLFERMQEKTADQGPVKASSDKAPQKLKQKSVPKAKTTRKKSSNKATKKTRPSKEDSTEAASVQTEAAQPEEPRGRKTIIRRRGVVLNKAKPSADECATDAASAPLAPSALGPTADPRAALVEGLKGPIRFDEAQSRIGSGYAPVMRELYKPSSSFVISATSCGCSPKTVQRRLRL